jgi:hypothetical protein
VYSSSSLGTISAAAGDRGIAISLVASNPVARTPPIDVTTNIRRGPTRARFFDRDVNVDRIINRIQWPRSVRGTRLSIGVLTSAAFPRLGPSFVQVVQGNVVWLGQVYACTGNGSDTECPASERNVKEPG